MKKILLIFLIPLMCVGQSKTALPSVAPTSFGVNLSKILVDCPNDFENITEAIKYDFEDKELRDYFVNTSLPFADSCYIYESIDENRGVISIYCAHFGTYSKKDAAVKVFKTLVNYLDTDKKTLIGFLKSELDDQDDEKYQGYRSNLSKNTDVLLEVSMEMDNLTDPNSKKTVDIWEVKLKVLEDSKLEN